LRPGRAKLQSFAAMGELIIRPATPSDGASVADIYRHHVLHGTASFDTTAPDEQQWMEKIDRVLSRRWPFLVAEQERHVVGYAYATQFRDRPAYLRTCENSIYIAPGHLGEGIGSMLLPALQRAAREAGFDEMIAVVGGAEPASVALHLKYGFVERGRLRNVGIKFGRRLDTVYLQSSLGECT
jgi:L-amino acid N-acyltransferase YncA